MDRSDSSEMDTICQRTYIAVAPGISSTTSAAYNAANDFVTWQQPMGNQSISADLNITSFVLFESESAILICSIAKSTVSAGISTPQH